VFVLSLEEMTFLECYEKHLKMKVDGKYNFLLEYYNVTARSGDSP
jgi:hypothetical protein